MAVTVRRMSAWRCPDRCRAMRARGPLRGASRLTPGPSRPAGSGSHRCGAGTPRAVLPVQSFHGAGPWRPWLGGRFRLLAGLRASRSHPTAVASTLRADDRGDVPDRSRADRRPTLFILAFPDSRQLRVQPIEVAGVDIGRAGARQDAGMRGGGGFWRNSAQVDSSRLIRAAGSHSFSTKAAESLASGGDVARSVTDPQAVHLLLCCFFVAKPRRRACRRRPSGPRPDVDHKPPRTCGRVTARGR